MKKSILFLSAALVLAACTQLEPVQDSVVDVSRLQFNITVNQADTPSTKGMKTAWENNDVVYVFFEDNTTQYVKMTYNGSSWAYADKEGGTTYSGLALTTSGKKVTAVYFPSYVNSTAPTGAESKFSFNDAKPGFFLTANEGYTVTSTSDVNTLSCTLNMTAPTGLVQVYVNESAPESGNEYVMTATHIAPYTFGAVTPGSAFSVTTGTAGFPLTAFSATIGSDAGYYFWGILEESARNTGTNYDFQLVTRNAEAEKKYAISSKSKSVTGKTITTAAIKLTGLTDKGNFVSMGYAGGPLWATGNLGRTNTETAISSENHKIVGPLEAGDYFQWGATVVYSTSSYSNQWTGTSYSDGLLPTGQDVAYQMDNTWRMPSKAQFDALKSNSSQKWETGWTSLGSTKGGYLVTSSANGISLFFAAAGYYYNGSPRSVGDKGDYWSSTPYHANLAYGLYFDTGDFDTDYGSRYYGFSVRPVQN